MFGPNSQNKNRELFNPSPALAGDKTSKSNKFEQDSSDDNYPSQMSSKVSDINLDKLKNRKRKKGSEAEGESDSEEGEGEDQSENSDQE